MKIQELYRTFLGKISFFGKIIDILLEQDNQIKDLQNKVQSLKELSSVQEGKIHSLELEIEGLAKTSPPKENTKNLTYTAGDIMQSVYTNYHATGEAVTPKEDA